MDKLVPLVGSCVLDNPNCVNDWMGFMPHGRTLALKTYTGNGLMEWDIYDILSEQGIVTKDIVALRDRNLLFFGFWILVQMKTYTDYFKATTYLLDLSHVGEYKFDLYKYNQEIYFPSSYSFRPLQFSFSPARLTINTKWPMDLLF